jgi:hypothetical protein
LKIGWCKDTLRADWHRIWLYVHLFAAAVYFGSTATVVGWARRRRRGVP